MAVRQDEEGTVNDEEDLKAWFMTKTYGIEPEARKEREQKGDQKWKVVETAGEEGEDEDVMGDEVPKPTKRIAKVTK